MVLEGFADDAHFRGFLAGFEDASTATTSPPPPSAPAPARCAPSCSSRNKVVGFDDDADAAAEDEGESRRLVRGDDTSGYHRVERIDEETLRALSSEFDQDVEDDAEADALWPRRVAQ